MKKRFNLFKQATSQLTEKESKKVIGAAGCGCGCAYANCGGSISIRNRLANGQFGWTSEHMTPQC